MFKKSRTRIVASIMSVLVLLLLGTLGIIYYTSYMDVYNQNQAMLERYIDANFKGLNNRRGERSEKHIYNENAFLLSTFYSVTVSGSGEILRVDNNNNTTYSTEDLTELAVSLIAGEKTQGTTGSLVYRVETGNGYTLVAFMDNTIFRRSITTLFEYTLIFGGVTIVLLFFLSVNLARRIVRPLEESYQRQTQFISDAGHELKTPVSVISTNAEMLSREIGENQWLSNIQFENSRMAVLIRQLMELAKMDQITPVMENVNFSRVVVGELLLFESAVYEKGLGLDYDSVAENVFIHGNAEQLGRLMSILLDNAINHCTGHGTIQVGLIAKHNRALLSVTNEGQEIPWEQRDLIFERFYRADFARTGGENHYGLGLAIAKSIAAAHHGDIAVSCENGLVTFSVSIPIASV